jgi:predicted ribosome quality control (RQC) complex YloA/Tae2 family protein
MKQIIKYIDSAKTNITFTVGKNAKENSTIIEGASPDDLWFHLENLPSEHVVATIPQDLSLDKTQIIKIAIQGAVLCKQYSKFSSKKNLPIIYTRIKDILKTEKIGCVIALNKKTLIV